MQLYEIRGLVEREGALMTFEQVQEEAWQLVLFLRMNNLVSDDSLPMRKQDVTMDFKLMTDQITEEGFQILKLGFYKWLDSNDYIHRKEIKLGVLEKALEKVRKDKN